MTFAERCRLELDYKKWLKRESIISSVRIEDCALSVIGYLDSKGLINAQPTIETPKWIRFEDKLPEQGLRVLVSTFGIVTTAWRTSKNTEELKITLIDPINNLVIPNIHLYTYHITHWMPLPEPPEGRRTTECLH